MRNIQDSVVVYMRRKVSHFDIIFDVFAETNKIRYKLRHYYKYPCLKLCRPRIFHVRLENNTVSFATKFLSNIKNHDIKNGGGMLLNIFLNQRTLWILPNRETL